MAAKKKPRNYNAKAAKAKTPNPQPKPKSNIKKKALLAAGYGAAGAAGFAAGRAGTKKKRVKTGQQAYRAGIKDAQRASRKGSRLRVVDTTSGVYVKHVQSRKRRR